MLKRLNKKELDKLRDELQPKSLNLGGFIEFLKSLPDDERKCVLELWQQSNIDMFPKLAERMIELNILSKEEFEKDWNHTDMSEIFFYVLTGEIQKVTDKKDQVVMVTTSEFKLSRKKQIFDKFSIKVVDPAEALVLMEKEHPEDFKKAKEMAHDDVHSQDYIG